MERSEASRPFQIVSAGDPSAVGELSIDMATLEETVAILLAEISGRLSRIPASDSGRTALYSPLSIEASLLLTSSGNLLSLTNTPPMSDILCSLRALVAFSSTILIREWA